jgi:peptide/nickel transport system substrate-binding protein
MGSNYWERYAQLRSSRRRFIQAGAAAGVGAAALGLVGCGDDDSGGTTPAAGGSTATAAPAVNRGGTMKFPLYGVSSGDPPTIYPFENLTYLAQIPSGKHYSRLLRGVANDKVAVEDKTVLEGDMASKWEVVDPTHYTFTLKPNIKWQNKAPMNGRAATAGDFVKTYEVFAKVSPNAAKFGGIIDKVEAPDEKTIKITLKQPFAPFLHAIAASAEGVWFIPVETIDSGQAKQDPVGTGPYIFRSFSPGVSIKWDKNPDYYDAPLPNFDKLEMGLTNDAQRIVAALQAGDLDWSALNGPIYKESKSKLDPKGTDIFTQSSVEGGIYFNFDNKPFQDKRVRQALSMIIDRDGMLKVQDGTGKGGYMSHQPPGQAPFFIDPRDPKFGANAKYYKRDLTAAKQLLSAAGAEGFSFKLIGNVDRYGPEAKQAWELITASLQEAGLKPELVFQEYATYIQTIFLGKMAEGNCAVGPFIGSANDPDDIFAALYWSKSARHNWGGTPIAEQAEIDTRIEKQRSILDLNERIEYVKEIQRFMADSMLTVPYHLSAGYAYAQPWMKNFSLKAGYSYLADGLMRASFDDARLKKG